MVSASSSQTALRVNMRDGSRPPPASCNCRILDFLDYDKQFDLKPPAADLVIDASKLGN